MSGLLRAAVRTVTALQVTNIVTTLQVTKTFQPRKFHFPSSMDISVEQQKQQTLWRGLSEKSKCQMGCMRRLCEKVGSLELLSELINQKSSTMISTCFTLFVTEGTSPFECQMQDKKTHKSKSDGC